MWSELLASLSHFDSAVVTGVDSTGYPVSVRCKPQADEERQGLILSLATDLGIQPGPATLLYHSHNMQLTNLKSFAVWGRLEAVTHKHSWIFYPTRVSHGMGFEEKEQIAAKAAATARKYLDQRGLDQPEVPWEKIKAIRANVVGKDL